MQPKRIASLALECIEDKKGEAPVVLDVAKLTTMAHYFVIAHGNSGPQVRAICNHLLATFKERKVPVYHSEGLDTAQWVLVDAGPVIIHVFHRDKRDFYSLESLWGGVRPDTAEDSEA